MAGVAMHGKWAHLVVRNLTATRPDNDGFNLADCQNVVFKNIRAIDYGDDGVSAHGVCCYRVDGFQSIGNATGICDTSDSITSYRSVYIDRCIGFDLYFLDRGRCSIADAHIRSSAGSSQIFGLPLVARGIRASNGLGNFDVPMAEWNFMMLILWQRSMREMLDNQRNAIGDRSAGF